MTPHFALSLERFGEQTALVLPDGTCISYLKLAQLADHFAQRFVQFDVWPQQIYALKCRNNLTTVVAYLCCLRHQRPLVLLDPTLAQSQLDYLIRQLEVAVLIDDFGQMQRVSPSAFRARTDLALLLSTSGSTGDPKSVMLSLDNLQQNALSISRYLPIEPADTVMTALPLQHAYGLSVLNSHLLCGARVLLTDQGPASKVFWEQLRQFDVNSISLLPHQTQLLQKLQFARLALPSLRYLTVAAGRLSADGLQYLQQLSVSRRLPVYLMYGQTEATARIGWLRPDYLPEHGDCIGEAIPGGELWLRDMQNGAEILTANTEGELVYRGPNVMLGYAQQAADLRSSGKLGELATGDLAIRQPNGLYQITGRLNRLLKIQGKRWQLDQLEQQLAREKWPVVCTGEDDQLLVAVIDADPASALPAKVQQWLSGRLPNACFQVILVRDIPYTSSGKVHYGALKQLAAADSPSTKVADL